MSVQCKNCGVWMATKMPSVANASPSLPNASDGDSNEKKVEKRRDSIRAIQDLWGVDGSGNASVANTSPSLPNAIDGDSSEKRVGKRRDSVGAIQDLWGCR